MVEARLWLLICQVLCGSFFQRSAPDSVTTHPDVSLRDARFLRGVCGSPVGLPNRRLGRGHPEGTAERPHILQLIWRQSPRLNTGTLWPVLLARGQATPPNLSTRPCRDTGTHPLSPDRSSPLSPLFVVFAATPHPPPSCSLHVLSPFPSARSFFLLCLVCCHLR